MLALLRVIVFEWILARLGLRWLLLLLVGVPAALLFFIGIPTLLVLGIAAALVWRMLRRPAPAAPAAPSAPSSP